MKKIISPENGKILAVAREVGGVLHVSSGEELLNWADWVNAKQSPFAELEALTGPQYRVTDFAPDGPEALAEFKQVQAIENFFRGAIEFEVKGVRAMWDPDLGPKGGWRCPPGTPAAGQWTNRFGTNCAVPGLGPKLGGRRGLISRLADIVDPNTPTPGGGQSGLVLSPPGKKPKAPKKPKAKKRATGKKPKSGMLLEFLDGLKDRPFIPRRGPKKPKRQTGDDFEYDKGDVVGPLLGWLTHLIDPDYEGPFAPVGDGPDGKPSAEDIVDDYFDDSEDDDGAVPSPKPPVTPPPSQPKKPKQPPKKPKTPSKPKKPKDTPKKPSDTSDIADVDTGVPVKKYNRRVDSILDEGDSPDALDEYIQDEYTKLQEFWAKRVPSGNIDEMRAYVAVRVGDYDPDSPYMRTLRANLHDMIVFQEAGSVEEIFKNISEGRGKRIRKAYKDKKKASADAGTPDVTPEAPEVPDVPEATPEAPEGTPEAAPDVPEVTPEETPDATPGDQPEPTPSQVADEENVDYIIDNATSNDLGIFGDFYEEEEQTLIDSILDWDEDHNNLDSSLETDVPAYLNAIEKDISNFIDNPPDGTTDEEIEEAKDLLKDVKKVKKLRSLNVSFVFAKDDNERRSILKDLAKIDFKKFYDYYLDLEKDEDATPEPETPEPPVVVNTPDGTQVEIPRVDTPDVPSGLVLDDEPDTAGSGDQTTAVPNDPAAMSIDVAVNSASEAEIDEQINFFMNEQGAIMDRLDAAGWDGDEDNLDAFAEQLEDYLSKLPPETPAEQVTSIESLIADIDRFNEINKINDAFESSNYDERRKILIEVAKTNPQKFLDEFFPDWENPFLEDDDSSAVPSPTNNLDDAGSTQELDDDDFVTFDWEGKSPQDLNSKLNNNFTNWINSGGDDDGLGESFYVTLTEDMSPSSLDTLVSNIEKRIATHRLVLKKYGLSEYPTRKQLSKKIDELGPFAAIDLFDSASFLAAFNALEQDLDFNGKSLNVKGNMIYESIRKLGPVWQSSFFETTASIIQGKYRSDNKDIVFDAIQQMDTDELGSAALYFLMNFGDVRDELKSVAGFPDYQDMLDNVDLLLQQNPNDVQAQKIFNELLPKYRILKEFNDEYSAALQLNFKPEITMFEIQNEVRKALYKAVASDLTGFMSNFMKDKAIDETGASPDLPSMDLTNPIFDASPGVFASDLFNVSPTSITKKEVDWIDQYPDDGETLRTALDYVGGRLAQNLAGGSSMSIDYTELANDVLEKIKNGELTPLEAEKKLSEIRLAKLVATGNGVWIFSSNSLFDYVRHLDQGTIDKIGDVFLAALKEQNLIPDGSDGSSGARAKAIVDSAILDTGDLELLTDTWAATNGFGTWDVPENPVALALKEQAASSLIKSGFFGEELSLGDISLNDIFGASISNTELDEYLNLLKDELADIDIPVDVTEAKLKHLNDFFALRGVYLYAKNGSGLSPEDMLPITRQTKKDLRIRIDKNKGKSVLLFKNDGSIDYADLTDADKKYLNEKFKDRIRKNLAKISGYPDLSDAFDKYDKDASVTNFIAFSDKLSDLADSMPEKADELKDIDQTFSLYARAKSFELYGKDSLAPNNEEKYGQDIDLPYLISSFITIDGKMGGLSIAEEVIADEYIEQSKKYSDTTPDTNGVPAIPSDSFINKLSPAQLHQLNVIMLARYTLARGSVEKYLSAKGELDEKDFDSLSREEVKELLLKYDEVDPYSVDEHLKNLNIYKDLEDAGYDQVIHIGKESNFYEKLSEETQSYINSYIGTTYQWMPSDFIEADEESDDWIDTPNVDLHDAIPDTEATKSSPVDTPDAVKAALANVEPLSEDELLQMDLHDPNGPWGPKPSGTVTYGVIYVDPDSGKILLRKPLNNYMGYHWTFPKGTPDPLKDANGQIILGDDNLPKFEHPLVTALREGAEETGEKPPSILGLLPGGHKSDSSTTFFIIASPLGLAGSWDEETSDVRYYTPEVAAQKISESTNSAGRKRDEKILATLLETLGNADDPTSSAWAKSKGKETQAVDESFTPEVVDTFTPIPGFESVYDERLWKRSQIDSKVFGTNETIDLTLESPEEDLSSFDDSAYFTSRLSSQKSILESEGHAEFTAKAQERSDEIIKRVKETREKLDALPDGSSTMRRDLEETLRKDFYRAQAVSIVENKHKAYASGFSDGLDDVNKLSENDLIQDFLSLQELQTQVFAELDTLQSAFGKGNLKSEELVAQVQQIKEKELLLSAIEGRIYAFRSNADDVLAKNAKIKAAYDKNLSATGFAPKSHLDLLNPPDEDGVARHRTVVGKPEIDTPKKAADHIANGGELRDVSDELLEEAIRSNVGTRFEQLPTSSGINDWEGSPTLVLRDTTNGRIYILKRPVRNDQEYLAELASNTIGSRLGMPMVGMRVLGQPYDHTNKTGSLAGTETTNRAILLEHVDNIVPSGSATSGNNGVLLARAAVLHFLVQEPDNHGDNRITRFDSKGKKYIVPFDHGKAFLPWNTKKAGHEYGGMAEQLGVGADVLGIISKDEQTARDAVFELRRIAKMLKDDPEMLVSDISKISSDKEGLTEKELARLDEIKSFVAAKVEDFDEELQEFINKIPFDIPETVAQVDISRVPTIGGAYAIHKKLGSKYAFSLYDEDEIADNSVVVGSQKMMRDEGANAGNVEDVALVQFTWRGATVPKSGDPAVNKQKLDQIHDDAVADGWELVAEAAILEWKHGPIRPDNPSAYISMLYAEQTTPARTYRKVLPNGDVALLYLDREFHDSQNAPEAQVSSVHGLVRIMVRGDEAQRTAKLDDEQFIKDVMTQTVGIKSHGKPSSQQLDSLGSIQLARGLSKVDDQEKALKEIEEKYGITLADVIVEVGSGGQPVFRLTDAAVDKVYEVEGLDDDFMFIHNTEYGTSDLSFEDKIVSMAINGYAGALLRFTFGIPSAGASPQEDIRNAGGKHMYLTKTKKTSSGKYLAVDGKKFLSYLGGYSNTGDSFGKWWVSSGKTNHVGATGEHHQYHLPMSLTPELGMRFINLTTQQKEAIIKKFEDLNIMEILGVSIYDLFSL
jgi:hypothetical protein